MSSMTDIVFLLLIFFMIASTLAKQLDTIKVDLPEAKGKTENRKSVAVSISSSQIFYVDDKPVNKINLQQEIINKMEGINPPSIVLRPALSVSRLKPSLDLEVSSTLKSKLIQHSRPN